jgi:hypothetical protein
VVDSANAGSKLNYSLGGAHQPLTSHAESDAKNPQGLPLIFEVTKPGWQTLTLRLDSLAGKEVGNLHRLELFGPAAVEARVLRARWRPAACHARFSSTTVPAPKLWVMTTRIAESAKVSSYSPVTTPFGYFGTSFNADGTSSGGANFSLWSFSAGKPKPQEQWSHMLAVGSSDAEFGSFGHEGSGVKLRGDWQPFGSDTREVTLALRGEVSGPWIHWFGYFLDPKTKRFRLYAAAADRQARLQASKGFLCRCRRCRLPPDQPLEARLSRVTPPSFLSLLLPLPLPLAPTHDVWGIKGPTRRMIAPTRLNAS